MLIQANVGTINNYGRITTEDQNPGSSAIEVSGGGVLSTLNNSSTGTIIGRDAIYNTGTITNLVNSGTISNTNRSGIYNLGTITSLTNSVGGVISGTGGLGAIFNDGSSSIVTFNNAQGGNSASSATTALVYNGKLPTNYNIIITSPTNYGQLSWTNANSGTSAGITEFGIYSGGITDVASSTVRKGTYSAVLSGLTTSNVGATRTGTYDGMTWTLALQSSSLTVWDLIVTGVSASYTQSSLNALATKLRGGFSGQTMATNFANMNTYL